MDRRITLDKTKHEKLLRVLTPFWIQCYSSDRKRKNPFRKDGENKEKENEDEFLKIYGEKDPFCYTRHKGLKDVNKGRVDYYDVNHENGTIPDCMKEEHGVEDYDGLMKKGYEKIPAFDYYCNKIIKRKLKIQVKNPKTDVEVEMEIEKCEWIRSSMTFKITPKKLPKPREPPVPLELQWCKWRVSVEKWIKERKEKLNIVETRLRNQEENLKIVGKNLLESVRKHNGREEKLQEAVRSANQKNREVDQYLKQRHEELCQREEKLKEAVRSAVRRAREVDQYLKQRHKELCQREEKLKEAVRNANQKKKKRRVTVLSISVTPPNDNASKVAGTMVVKKRPRV